MINNAKLWPNNHEKFFHEKLLCLNNKPKKNDIFGILSIISHQKNDFFSKRANKWNPVTWSDALRVLGMKLAYCPTDLIKLKSYIHELVDYDDMFIICYYKKKLIRQLDRHELSMNQLVLKNNFKVVLLFRNKIYHSNGDGLSSAIDNCLNSYVKAIFRVVPENYYRGI